jgi:hypothetical protein
MQDAKERLEVLHGLALKQSSSGLTYFETEFASLQIRKILECVAFSSLAANRTAYQAAFPKMDRHWKAKKIIGFLQDVHPNFYPKPLKPLANGHFEHLQEAYLTQDDFNFLYDCSSRIIHHWNPYDQRPRQVNFEKPLIDWFYMIFRLLNLHYATVANTNNLLVVQLQNTEDQKVHVAVAESTSKI